MVVAAKAQSESTVLLFSRTASLTAIEVPRPTCRGAVHDMVFLAGYQSEVFESVIGTDAVDVMHVMSGRNWSVGNLPDHPMLKSHRSVMVDADVTVACSASPLRVVSPAWVPEARLACVAKSTAEQFTSDFGSNDACWFPALSAGLWRRGLHSHSAIVHKQSMSATP